MKQMCLPGFRRRFLYAGIVVLITGISGCDKNKEQLNTDLEAVAGNDEALAFMKTFDGRGTLSDSSEATAADAALKTFRHPDDLALDLVLSEPRVTQPVFMTFDHKGRLWVVQYNQYPYPKGLKVLKMDQHIRAQYDKVPQPPPEGQKGADKITFFEDTDGDGQFDRETESINGLNIATSVALGRDKIWVLDPPYLLAYMDGDNNGVPEGEPVVHLEGFGIEDTHAVANNLRWGPDGWLYGAQGSTCTANVSSTVSKNVRFNGQAIWRYHPDTHVFEVFAEGGGNTFDVEIDDKGRLYSGDNGVSRGRYYKQGAYFTRSLGKHGVYTNVYTFGNLPDMELTGDKVRFTHAFIRYQEHGLPAKYQDHMIALNPLQSYVQLSSFEPKGSSFKVEDKSRIIETTDHWFRPVDITPGPDGAVYIADWYDSRLSHVDPRDTWSKTTGRIYRLRSADHPATFARFDISAYSSDQLIKVLSNVNRWYRQQALLEIGNRKDSTLLPHLKELLRTEEGQTALEAFWAINLSGGWDESIAIEGLHHRNPYVRMWAVRLLGDARSVSRLTERELWKLAANEDHPEVRSQLAATAKRLPESSSLPIVQRLLKGQDDADDPDLPMQIWWALEASAVSNRSSIVDIFKDKSLWSNRVVAETVLSRLVQRWMMEGGEEDYAACAALLKLSPSSKLAGPLISGIQEGLRGRNVTELTPELVRALKPFQSEYKDESTLLALRQGNAEKVGEALRMIADGKTEIGLRLSYIKIFGEINQPACVPVLLKLLETNRSSPAIKQASLEALSRYDDPGIGARVTRAYPDQLRFDPMVRDAALMLLAQRKLWAIDLLDAIDKKKEPGEKFIAHTIDKSDVSGSIARQLALLDDPSVAEAVHRLWPDALPASSAEKNERIVRVNQTLKSGSGNVSAGKEIFANRCATCHRLFGEGAEIGPELTGYDRKNINEMLINIVDPSAYIREGYVMYHIKTKDKRSIIGTMKSQHGSTLVIQPFNGEGITLDKEQIEEMVEQKVSLMPEGLLNGLSDQEVRDLIAYISHDR